MTFDSEKLQEAVLWLFEKFYRDIPFPINRATVYHKDGAIHIPCPNVFLRLKIFPGEISQDKLFSARRHIESLTGLPAYSWEFYEDNMHESIGIRPLSSSGITLNDIAKSLIEAHGKSHQWQNDGATPGRLTKADFDLFRIIQSPSDHSFSRN